MKICPLQQREAGVRRLYRNLVDSVKESEIKLGYDYGALRLFYPLATLNHLLQMQVSAAEMQKVLEAFAGCEKETLGALEISAAGERFSVLVPAEGVKYVHEHVEASEFLKELVSQTAAHGCSLEKAEAVFHRYSDQVVCKKMDHGEFDEVLYFADGKPDDYLYCLHEEGGHITYHRFDREDYQDFGF
ncbi:MAG: DUF3877 family protein [Eubacteriales bacterium]|nr:DUF3877 family protein [Eubacteriales bacterium]